MDSNPDAGLEAATTSHDPRLAPMEGVSVEEGDARGDEGPPLVPAECAASDADGNEAGHTAYSDAPCSQELFSGIMKIVPSELDVSSACVRKYIHRASVGFRVDDPSGDPHPLLFLLEAEQRRLLASVGPRSEHHGYVDRLYPSCLVLPPFK